MDGNAAPLHSLELAPSMSAPPTYVAVVDDDRSVCLSFARLLRAAGIQAITYGSAEAFLADTKRPQFDCMVFDVQLGGMSGIELARKLAATGGPPAPVIYITAHDDPETRASAEASGCAAYFRKNESPAVLWTIRRLTEYHDRSRAPCRARAGSAPRRRLPAPRLVLMRSARCMRQPSPSRRSAARQDLAAGASAAANSVMWRPTSHRCASAGVAAAGRMRLRMLTLTRGTSGADSLPIW